jgi:hypothetical protein
MQAFLLKLLIFSVPFVLLTASFLVLDPFEVVHPDQPIESGNPVSINVDFLTTEAYMRYRESVPYDAFIFGNSRTLAFRTSEWNRHVPGITPFRYSASRESLFGVRGKLRLIDRTGTRVRHALLLVDRSLLRNVNNSPKHLYIKHPLVSGESWTTFYMAFLSAYISDFFFAKHLDYLIFGTFRPYMEGAINTNRMQIDPRTNDLFMLDYEASLARDEESYYREKRPVFELSRRRAEESGGAVIGTPQRAFLEEIRAILEEHGADVHVIVSPNYDQIPLHSDDLAVLRDLFGARRVHDYSGVNEITRHQRNYYEAYHFKPSVGSGILSQIYGQAHP